MFHYFLSQNAKFHSQLIRGKANKFWLFNIASSHIWFDWFMWLLVDVIVGDEKAFVWLRLIENLSVLLVGVSLSSKKRQKTLLLGCALGSIFWSFLLSLKSQGCKGLCHNPSLSFANCILGSLQPRLGHRKENQKSTVLLWPLYIMVGRVNAWKF